MSSFFVELWEGIFTPGPTPTILKATNVSFAALQVVLLSLLYATYSVHFVVLSALCGGLWWSINWFARELKIAQAAEAERKKKEDEKKKLQGDGSGSSDTEVEGKVARRTTRSSKKSGAGPAAAAAAAAAVKADAEPLESRGEVKQRAVLEPQSSGTEDEWERVSESER